MNNPYNIYFDMQRNSFYRIDKSTGTTAHTYLNGQNIPYFKPNITGFQPNRRKNIIQNDYFSMKQSPKRITIVSQSKKLAKLNLSTLQSQKSTINQQKKYQTLNSERKIHQYQFQPNSTKYLHSTIKDRKQQTEFIEKIRKFQQITSNKTKDNHSPRKDSITGSVEKKEILEKLCITMSNFNTQLNWSSKQLESPQNKDETTRKSINHNRTLSNHYTTQNQLKNERNTNLFIIKSVKKHSEQKSLERDKFRKQNLKKLQKNMLIRNSKGQHKIFGSDERS